MSIAYHTNAKLTVHQRREIHDKFRQGASLADLAAAYHVTTKTIQKWAHRMEFTDRQPLRAGKAYRPPGLKAAVRQLMRRHHSWGTHRLLDVIRRHFPLA